MNAIAVGIALTAILPLPPKQTFRHDTLPVGHLLLLPPTPKVDFAEVKKLLTRYGAIDAMPPGRDRDAAMEQWEKDFKKCFKVER